MLRSLSPDALAPAILPLRAFRQRHLVEVLDQTRLPRDEVSVSLTSAADAARAIATMQVRGAPLIGVTAAYGLALSLGTDPSDAGMDDAYTMLLATRPTAVNLRWALERVRATVAPQAPAARAEAAWDEADAIAAEDAAINRAIGEHGLTIIEELAARRSPVQVLTHCNAGALATAGDYGTALGVIRGAIDAGKKVAVIADETRPFLQGLRLTAWELAKDNIPVTVITDSMAGHVMKNGQVDAVVVGADRIASNGDTANKIGTYMVAVLAKQHNIPFYVAAPITTLDLTLASGAEIPIEERDPSEVTHIRDHQLAPDGISVQNPAFDVTPNELITAIITDRGVAEAPFEASLRKLCDSAKTAEKTTGR